MEVEFWLEIDWLQDVNQQQQKTEQKNSLTNKNEEHVHGQKKKTNNRMREWIETEKKILEIFFLMFFFCGLVALVGSWLTQV